MRGMDTPVDRNELAYCLLLQAGATKLEAWDYAPRVANDSRPIWARTMACVRMDLAMWRKGVK